jgi:hypothetical protein
MRRSFLRPLLLLSIAVAACGGKASEDESRPAAGGPSGSDPAGTDASVPPRTLAAFCAGGAAQQIDRELFRALTPSPPADYLALRHLTGGFDEPDGGRELVTEAERGERCSTASDRASCEHRYETIGDIGLFYSYVFFTRGDEVGKIEDAPSAMRLLGTIDSPEEAFFVAGKSGFYATCDVAAQAAYRKVGDAYELVTQRGGCKAPLEEVIVHVHANGTVEEVSKKTIGAEKGCL